MWSRLRLIPNYGKRAYAEEKVTFGQLGICQGSISEAASGAIDLSTFKAKEDITTALSLLEEAKVPR